MGRVTERCPSGGCITIGDSIAVRDEYGRQLRLIIEAPNDLVVTAHRPPRQRKSFTPTAGGIAGILIGVFCGLAIAKADSPDLSEANELYAMHEPVHVVHPSWPESTDPRDRVPVPVPCLLPDAEVPTPVPPSTCNCGCCGDGSVRDSEDDNAMELRVYNRDPDGTEAVAPNPADITLRECFERHYLPYKQFKLSPKRLQVHRTTIGHWEAFIADQRSPTRTPLEVFGSATLPVDLVSQIDVRVRNAFGLWLLSKEIRQSTVDKYSKSLSAILQSVGPVSKDFPVSPEFFRVVPGCESAYNLSGREIQDVRTGRNFDDDLLNRLYAACVVARWPKEEPVLHWRTFVVVTSLCGGRVEDSVTLGPSDFHFKPKIPLDGMRFEHPHGWITFMASKTGKLHAIPIPEIVRRHVEELMGRRGGRLFAWTSYEQSSFRSTWNAIRDRLGESDVQRRDLRSTAANRWSDIDDGLAGWLLGHTYKTVTEASYRDRLPGALRVVNELQVPSQYLTLRVRDPMQPMLF